MQLQLLAACRFHYSNKCSENMDSSPAQEVLKQQGVAEAEAVEGVLGFNGFDT